MREIKFRAWDKKSKEMTTGFAVFADGRGAGAYHPSTSDGDEVYDYLEPMQYTGLKDKNGKEIYEGDIIFSKFPTEEYPGWGVIEYWPDLARYQVVNEKENENWDLWQDEAEHDMEIKGNIYENPDLLK